MTVVRTGLPFVWGATENECARRYVCDAYLPAPDHRFYRAIDVAAPASLTFRWLLQLQLAPYSYDWADNFWLPSPGRLCARAASTAPGRRMMHVFHVLEWQPGREITLGPAFRWTQAILGTLVGTYTVTECGPFASRLFVKVNAVYPRSLYGRCVAPVMPWIDVLMMRQQLRTLRRFIERDARRCAARSAAPRACANRRPDGASP